MDGAATGPSVLAFRRKLRLNSIEINPNRLLLRSTKFTSVKLDPSFRLANLGINNFCDNRTQYSALLMLVRTEPCAAINNDANATSVRLRREG